VISIHVKPFRERIEDIVPIFKLMLLDNISDGATAPLIDPTAKAILEAYPWPGNAEELANAAKYAISHLVAGVVTKESLPAKVANAPAKPLLSGENKYKAKYLKAFLKSKGANMMDQLMKKDSAARKDTKENQ
jgi:DNA-binding NtrC family response regulator